MHAGLIERFWNFVPSRGGSGCWLWNGPTSKGYGALTFRAVSQRKIYSHRLSYEIHNGRIPDGMFVCHTCDVRNCVNPSHLYVGTPADNNRDRVNRGRSVGARKLTPEDVEFIRSTRPHGRQVDVYANVYGVGRTTIYRIMRRGWKTLGHHSTSKEKSALVEPATVFK